MKKFLIVGSSLAPLFCAATAGAVDITLGGSIDMGIEFGLGKNSDELSVKAGYSHVALSISAAHTTHGGLAFGGKFGLSTSTEIGFNPYTDANGDRFMAKRTVDGRTNITANIYNVSGGAKVTSDNVVSVKINSNWLGVDQGQVEHTLALVSFTSSNICKLAGRGTVYGGGQYGGVYTTDPSGKYFGDSIKTVTGGGDFAADSAGDDYLPAGQFLGALSVNVYAANPTYTVSNDFNTGYQSLKTTHGGVAMITAGLGENPTDKQSLKATWADSGNLVTRIVEAYSKAAVDVDADGKFDVLNAAVFAGPFMEVMMSSSETKMVVGAACLEGNEASKTAFFLDNASDVMTVSDASVYIEGGFGKLTLQTGSYAGGVTSIAGAGDVADINAGGLVVITQGVGLFGANPYLAVDLAKGDSLGALEVITGGIIDMGDLYAAVDVALDNPSDVFGISAWDLGLAYDMGDLSLGFATDSSSDWGLSASMAIAGFGVKTVFGSSSSGDHTKSGITYSVRASTALNGFKLALGFDQDLEPTVGVSYDLGGLVLSAGYDAGDEGGSLGAKLSF